MSRTGESQASRRLRPGAEKGQELASCPGRSPGPRAATRARATARDAGARDAEARDAEARHSDGLIRCYDCAHAREVSETDPIEWRCRAGRLRGGRVHRPGTPYVHAYLLRRHRCEQSDGMD